MKLMVNKDNIIGHEEIALNGLTMIVGEDNSGKSTIGRTLFSVVKALNNTLDVDSNYITHKVRSHLTNLRSRLHSVKSEDFFLQGEPNSQRRVFCSIIDYQKDLEAYPSVDDYVSDKSARIFNMEITPRMKLLLMGDFYRCDN